MSAGKAAGPSTALPAKKGSWLRVRRLVQGRRKAPSRQSVPFSTDNVATWFTSCAAESSSSTSAAQDNGVSHDEIAFEEKPRRVYEGADRKYEGAEALAMMAFGPAQPKAGTSLLLSPRAARQQANGHANGLANGLTNGHSNGHANGHTNGHANGRTRVAKAAPYEAPYEPIPAAPSARLTMDESKRVRRTGSSNHATSSADERTKPAIRKLDFARADSATRDVLPPPPDIPAPMPPKVDVDVEGEKAGHGLEHEQAEAAAALIAALASEASVSPARGPVGFDAIESEGDDDVAAAATPPAAAASAPTTSGDGPSDATAKALAMLQLQMAALMASQRRTEDHVATIAARLDQLVPPANGRPRDARAVGKAAVKFHAAASSSTTTSMPMVTPSPTLHAQSQWLQQASESGSGDEIDEMRT